MRANIHWILNKALHFTVLLCIASAAGLLLLILVYLLPTGCMREHAEKTLGVMEEQGARYHVVSGLEALALDNYTDAIMLNTAVYHEDESVLMKAAAAYRYGYAGETDFGSFLKYLRGEPDWQRVSYARYWNGYLVALKPLLMVLTYSGIKRLNFVLQLALTVAVAVAMARRKKGQYIVSFLLGVWFLMPVTTVMSMQYSQIYYVTMGVLLIFLCRYGWIGKRKYFEEFYLCAGMLTCFFDFLTYPLVSLGFLLVMHLILDEDGNEKESCNVIGGVVLRALCWGIGYIGIWGAKWCIASIVLRENIIGEALGQILFRASPINTNNAVLEHISRAGALAENVKMLLNPLFITALALFGAVIIWRIVRIRGKINIAYRGEILGMLLVALLPVVWLMLKANHSYVHAWMTYRELATVIFAFAAALISITMKRVERQDGV